MLRGLTVCRTGTKPDMGIEGIASPDTGPNLREHDRRGKRRRAPAVEDPVNTAIPAPLRNDAFLASRRRESSKQEIRM